MSMGDKLGIGGQKTRGKNGNSQVVCQAVGNEKHHADANGGENHCCQVEAVYI